MAVMMVALWAVVMVVEMAAMLGHGLDMMMAADWDLL